MVNGGVNTLSKKRILFIITTSTNMGDLALCQEWSADLGSKDYSYSYVLSPKMNSFIDKKDQFYNYQKNKNVKDTILNAIEDFKPHALIFATNAFWNLPEYKGAEFGKFILKKSDVNIPVLSFDPFEIGFKMKLPKNGTEIKFSKVPDWVYALRYMSRIPLSDNAHHFCTQTVFNRKLKYNKEALFNKYGLDISKKTIVFPISKDRYQYIENNYPSYYKHLSELFSQFPSEEIQFIIISHQYNDAFRDMKNVIQIDYVKYVVFLDLIHASDIYLTDSFVSCIVNAFNLNTPAILLSNSTKNKYKSNNSFLSNHFFPYKIFPYGMEKICNQLEELFEVQDCYITAEVLDKEDFGFKINRLLYQKSTKKKLENACKKWKDKRKNLQRPGEILEKILETHNSLEKNIY